MRRRLTLSLLIFPSGLLCAAFVVWIFAGRYVRYSGMASWYLPFMVTSMAAWAIAMVGLLKIRFIGVGGITGQSIWAFCHGTLLSGSFGNFTVWPSHPIVLEELYLTHCDSLFLYRRLLIICKSINRSVWLHENSAPLRQFEHHQN